MTFTESTRDEFKDFSKSIQDTIRSFDGCEHLDIYQDINNKSVFFSYSYWKSEDHLNSYRYSDWFKKTWAKTREWFGDKPEAWSVEKL